MFVFQGEFREELPNADCSRSQLVGLAQLLFPLLAKSIQIPPNCEKKD
jgi:hypothetical protein